MANPRRPVVPYIVGDGTGPQLWAATRPVLDAAVARSYDDGRAIDWVEAPVGDRGVEECGTPLPDASLTLLREHPRAIKGPLGTAVGGGARSLNMALRHDRDLYAGIRPISWIPCVPSVVRDPGQLDVVLFRETTEDVFTGNEFVHDTADARLLRDFCRDRFGWSIPDDAGVGMKHISETASKRIVRAAIRYAVEQGRRSVTLVHKGNAMKATEGAFLRWGYEVAAEEFPDVVTTDAPAAGQVRIDDVIADAMMQAILLRPDEFDVIATTNLNGDYLSDALAAQVGGVGMAPGVNVNPESGAALYEATHGTAPRYAGADRVNPSALIRSGELLLRDLGWVHAADQLAHALIRVFAARTMTYDVARLADDVVPVGTAAFADAVVAAIETDPNV